jgi:hypothetical protein
MGGAAHKNKLFPFSALYSYGTCGVWGGAKLVFDRAGPGPSSYRSPYGWVGWAYLAKKVSTGGG